MKLSALRHVPLVKKEESDCITPSSLANIAESVFV